MTPKTPISLTVAGLFLKIISWFIVVLALDQIKSTQDNALIIFLELFGLGLFFVTWKMQNNMEEWARLTCWGFALLAGGYFILDYSIHALTRYHFSNPAPGQLILGVCFIWLFVYLSQPRIKRLFQLKLARAR